MDARIDPGSALVRSADEEAEAALVLESSVVGVFPPEVGSPFAIELDTLVSEFC